MKKSVLLMFSSIFYIVLGLGGIILFSLVLFGAASAGSPVITWVTAIALITCLLELITGIVGFKAGNGKGGVTIAKALSIFIFIGALFSIYNGVVTDLRNIGVWLHSIFGAIIPIFYFIGAMQLKDSK